MQGREIIDEMSLLFQAGDIETLAEHFAVPLILFPAKGPPRTASRPALFVAMKRVVQASWDAGTTTLTWEELAYDVQSECNFAILARWQCWNAKNQQVATSDIRYYFGPSDTGALRILMLEYLSEAFPEANAMPPDKFATLRLI